ncbi:Hypothetical Protein FCC1311_082112 [Hondaea fermentalgiana]|uniref:Uncharacterized protein n=1 Tax=Hondaea fermentalgiana TaxID=2315210 RepID=A0A2R5GM68_9STRA|nr:Hypothetical Protein FCC1311_082112 [Hondaea fermentalgiana]|eukprot:GBG31986.1 Hypothetical Protein FCC1311_082112 [Hondaea fermentalgiana]
MGSITCREAVATFICKERSAFIEKVSMLASQLHSVFCKLEFANFDLLRFAVVQENLLPNERAGWKPHESDRVMPVTTVQRGGLYAYSLIDAPKNCSTRLSRECVCDWTRNRNCSYKDHAVAGHGNAYFNRCNAWMRYWVKQLQGDQRLFSIPNGLELLRKNKVIAKIARPATSGKKQQRRRTAATEDDDGDWNTSFQNPFGR